MNLNESIGKRIVALRKKRSLTQAQLAELLGISIKHCSSVERGVSSFSLELLIELCKIFDVSLDYLVLGKDHTPSAQMPVSLVEYYANSDESHLELINSYIQMFFKIQEQAQEKHSLKNDA